MSLAQRSVMCLAPMTVRQEFWSGWALDQRFKYLERFKQDAKRLRSEGKEKGCAISFSLWGGGR